MRKTRVVILGGGFAGVYVALQMERILARREDLHVTLVNHENFFLFTPMLHEVAASELDPGTIVNPIHKLLKRVEFFCGTVRALDVNTKRISVSHGISEHTHTIEYDHLVLGLGSVTHFFDLPGVETNALTMRTLGDAIALRNRVIGLLEEANFECCRELREKLLTFVIAGGGFAGVETAAAIHDFVEHILPYYPNLSRQDCRFVIVHSGGRILPELDPRLGDYAGALLEKRGIEVCRGTRLLSYMDDTASLSSGVQFQAATLVWAAGSAAHPLLESIVWSKERGRVRVTEHLNVSEIPSIWAAGDCAAVPDKESGRFSPPTAQHALRQATVLAKNIVRTVDNEPLQPFRFKSLGQLASLGRRRGVAQIRGIRFSGFLAWRLWRSVYLMKLPRVEKKLRVALEWTLDLVFAPDNVQLPVHGRPVQSLIAEGAGR